jgi:cation diffusion facilitator CzcD-associated flavoprotein CzcO
VATSRTEQYFIPDNEQESMTVADTIAKPEPTVTENFDVLIVGAGISGVGAAYHLTHQRPGTSFVVLEALDSFGGTWWTHRYPGIRSDSDLYTFGYRFKPWIGAPIATADEIRKYMGEVIDENHLACHIRYDHKIMSAQWSTKDNRWTIDAVRTDTGASQRFTASFLWMCQGYYRHSEGYTPEWAGMDQYKGQIVHPQSWPEDLDYANKKVVVIGSGATAATLVPAIAADCAHVTVLQRSPTYFIPGRNQNDLADTLRELDIDEAWIHEIVRRKILHDLHPALLRGAGGGETRAARWRARLPGAGLRYRDAFHAALSPLASAHRLRAGRRHLSGHPLRQGLHRH